MLLLWKQGTLHSWWIYVLPAGVWDIPWGHAYMQHLSTKHVSYTELFLVCNHPWISSFSCASLESQHTLLAVLKLHITPCLQTGSSLQTLQLTKLDNLFWCIHCLGGLYSVLLLSHHQCPLSLCPIDLALLLLFVLCECPPNHALYIFLNIISCLLCLVAYGYIGNHCHACVHVHIISVNMKKKHKPGHVWWFCFRQWFPMAVMNRDRILIVQLQKQKEECIAWVIINSYSKHFSYNHDLLQTPMPCFHPALPITSEC